MGALAAVALTLGMTLPLALSASAAVSPGTVGTGAKFEDNDANLNVDNAGYFDWNSFAPVSWTGDAPYQEAAKTATNSANDQVWTFAGVTDAQASTSDTGFAGGVKQDFNCPHVIGSKAPNKDDLQSAYLATSRGTNGDTYLTLAWERIPQNTTSPSAHVAFEFNQGSTACGSASDSLVNRTAGDMLIVYDFQGGSTSTPTIGLSRWITSGTCQVGSDSPPCWGVQTELPADQAEGAVNTGLSPYPGTVSDSVAEGSYLSPSGPLSLDASQFGEAGVDLSKALPSVFGSSATSCTTFGKAWAVSRSSGNSSTAAMEDLVGPTNFTISNCGSLGITKVSSKSSSTTLEGATFNIYAGSTASGTPVATATTGTDGTACASGLVAGTYTVQESSAPAGYAKDPTAQTATVTADSTCANNNLTFTDTPLTDVTVNSASEVSGTGGTSSTITCTPTGSTTGIGDSPQSGQSATVTATGLLPGSYTCTVVIDP